MSTNEFKSKYFFHFREGIELTSAQLAELAGVPEDFARKGVHRLLGEERIERVPGSYPHAYRLAAARAGNVPLVEQAKSRSPVSVFALGGMHV